MTGDNEKKVLIITYYWPPSGGSGVQRWLKFVKYLPQFGYTPYVFTPENPSFSLRDPSLQKDVPPEAEVIHFPIWEPYDAFFRLSSVLSGSKVKPSANLVSSEKKSFFQRVSTWIRGNLFIPDPRIFWVRPSVRVLHDIIADNGIKTIVTTGPPHSVHLIGYQLKIRNPSIRWMADFRDPWSEWGLLDSLGAGKLARQIHRKLEQKVLTTADEVITITPFYVRKFERLSGRKVTLLTNGYDEDDFSGLNIKPTDRFVIRHVGIVNEKCNPRPFMGALKSFLMEHPSAVNDVKLDFTGVVHNDLVAYVRADATLSAITSFTDPVPHKQLIGLYNESSLLLLILTGYRDAEGYMPGKLFEYIATGLPVLGVGPEQGDAAGLMNKAERGVMIDGTKTEEIVHVISKHYYRWKERPSEIMTSAPAGFSRKEVTAELARLIGE